MSKIFELNADYYFYNDGSSIGSKNYPSGWYQFGNFQKEFWPFIAWRFFTPKLHKHFIEIAKTKQVRPLREKFF